jgi:hypothetical protein
MTTASLICLGLISGVGAGLLAGLVVDRRRHRRRAGRLLRSC